MKQFLRFLLVGVLNTSLGYAIIFICMYAFGLSAVLSNVVGYMFGLSASYSLNRDFTFRSTSKSKVQLFRFLGVFFVAYLANLGMLIFLIYILNAHHGVAQILAGVAYVLTSYFLNKFYVFRNAPANRA